MTYALLARYYDLENADFTEDLDFWLELAEEHGDPVLELGCGTGRVLLHLARRGHAVTGIDNSPEMLARLETKWAAARNMRGGVQPNAPTVIRADMKDFTTEQRFRLALMPFNTFMHLLTLEDQIAALSCICKHLQPGAALALDMPNPGAAYAAPAGEQGLTLERTFMDGESGSAVQQFSSVAVDRAAQLAHITWLYDAVAPDGTVQRAIVPLTLRYTFPGEMRLLLEKCGFTLAHLYGDYQRAPFADGSPRMIVVATAP
jgi:SAM-dependent methyltransferase